MGGTFLPQPDRAGGGRTSCGRYSPEFNAVEEMWSKVKHAVRRARADTAAALTEALGAAVAALTSEDSFGWLRHAGYRVNLIE